MFWKEQLALHTLLPSMEKFLFELAIIFNCYINYSRYFKLDFLCNFQCRNKFALSNPFSQYLQCWFLFVIFYIFSIKKEYQNLPFYANTGCNFVFGEFSRISPFDFETFFIKVSVMQVKSFEVKLFFVLPLTTCYFIVSLVINIAAHPAAF